MRCADMTKAPICLLAVEASGNCASLAVASADGVLGSARRDQKHGHAASMTLLLRQCLGEAGVKASDLTHVAAGCGPGSFTGIRVGLGLAKGVALALDVPIYGVSSLRALVTESPVTAKPAAILVAVDSRRGGYFASVYDKAAAVMPVFEGDAEAIADKVKSLPLPCVVLGHDAGRLAETLAKQGGRVTASHNTDPNAVAVAHYARQIMRARAPMSDYPAIPQYHRAPSLASHPRF